MFDNVIDIGYSMIVKVFSVAVGCCNCGTLALLYLSGGEKERTFSL